MKEKIIVDPVTRIEGHAKIVLDTNDAGEITGGHLQVLEIRGFEKLLEGMELFKMPLITGRICGVCPAAHHLVSVTAIENGLGVKVPPDALLLRELMYMGHIIHSHSLSTFVLTGPDVLVGIGAKPKDRNALALLAMAPEIVKKVLRLRSIGQKIVEMVGGRGVHPVTSVPGGQAFRPTKDDISKIGQWGEEAGSLLKELSEVLMKKLENISDLFEITAIPYHSMALTDKGKVTFMQNVCRVVDTAGKEERSFTAGEYADNLVEHPMQGSYMRSVRLKSGGEEKKYFVGPLARLNVNEHFSTPEADRLLGEFRSSGSPRLSAIDYLQARLIEMMYCAERLVAICGKELGDGPIIKAVTPKGGRFTGLIEAPRGILIHDYEADDEGKITSANLIVATQNNYDAIDHTITALTKHFRQAGDDNLLMNGAEFALRCFDPCLACATHAAGCMPIIMELRRNGRVVRAFRRGAEE
ncbi:MAG: Ni/Fe hydrogenase subunit alpha [Candidatus Fermentibacteraceae bacterium]|nr:Ni/Fe hydrogenase subunit alpha [Candidatus Fermentibacteraceae bacterium]MBN2609610.1 Ni/Fe hydrogenase subunit alpha [Candidatus Fermentibacteraceae bacterium]